LCFACELGKLFFAYFVQLTDASLLTQMRTPAGAYAPPPFCSNGN
jgi:hypothetical protein